MLWLALTGLAACAGLLVALPFLRTRGVADAATTQMDIYRAQLNDLAREEAAGEIDVDAASVMRTEIERRILDTTEPLAPARTSTQNLDRITAATAAAVVVLGSVALYAVTTPQNAGDAPDASGATAQNLADIDAAIVRLEQRLEQSPGDAEGWRMLGWSYFETGRYAQSVEAYRRAVVAAPSEVAYQSALAEALTWANEGAVSNEARDKFRAALRRDPSDERARYYLALAKAQQGDLRGAVDDWIEALAAASPQSEWAPTMRADAEAAARDAGIDIAGRLPPPPAEVVAGSGAPPHPVTARTPADGDPQQAQQDMVADMVGNLERRLARDPRDADGWVLLMRSRMVMGQPDRAQAALASGLDAFNGDRATQDRLRTAATELNIPNATR